MIAQQSDINHPTVHTIIYKRRKLLICLGQAIPASSWIPRERSRHPEQHVLDRWGKDTVFADRMAKTKDRILPDAMVAEILLFGSTVLQQGLGNTLWILCCTRECLRIMWGQSIGMKLKRKWTSQHDNDPPTFQHIHQGVVEKKYGVLWNGQFNGQI